MNENAGHRQRVKDRFRKEGLDSFDSVHALELLLFYAVPRQETKTLARRLLHHFGSFYRVLDATAEELEQVEGVGEGVSTFLTLVNSAGRYYLVDRNRNIKVLSSYDEYGDYLLHQFYGRTREISLLLCLDAAGKVLCCRELGEGSINCTAISTRKVVELALGVGASVVVLAHNHPSGVAFPSDEDISTTRRIAAALATVDICLADHVIVAEQDYISLAQSGYYSYSTQTQDVF